MIYHVHVTMFFSIDNIRQRINFKSAQRGRPITAGSVHNKFENKLLAGKICHGDSKPSYQTFLHDYSSTSFFPEATLELQSFLISN